MNDFEPMEKLRLADPDIYLWIKSRMVHLSGPPSAFWLETMVEETILGLSQETGFGRAIAEGFLFLAQNKSRDHVEKYAGLVRQAGRVGASYGRILAVHLPPVLSAGEPLLNRFLKTLAIMREKGTYTLNAPLEALTQLLHEKDLESAYAYLDLLGVTFEQRLSYNSSLTLAHLIPKAVRSFSQKQRHSCIRQLQRVVQAGYRLADPFLEGIDRGLYLLSNQDLDKFVSIALNRRRAKPRTVENFLNLSSLAGRQTCRALQTAAPLDQIRDLLYRYLNARLGRCVNLKPLSDLSTSGIAIDSLSCTDGIRIYLPDQVSRFKDQDRNIRFYKTLVRLEAAFLEFGSLDFDLERAVDQHPEISLRLEPAIRSLSGADKCDGQRFLDLFPNPVLACDLFNLIEQARVLALMRICYPGMMSQIVPLLRDEMALRRSETLPVNFLEPVYNRLVLGLNTTTEPRNLLSNSLFGQMINQAADTVESSAARVCQAYDWLVKLGLDKTYGQIRLFTPFGWRLNWPLVSLAQKAHCFMADQVKLKIAKQGVSIYRSELMRLFASSRQPNADKLKTLILSKAGHVSGGGEPLDWKALGIEALPAFAGDYPSAALSGGGPFFSYPEWNQDIQDYLDAHVRVRQIDMFDSGDSEFYSQTLSRHHGLISRTRRAFGLLKPEGLTLLRQWPEGDTFDHRALIDFAVDRKAGRLSSGRLFIKRLKHVRDVAVLVLTDLSRSTANQAVSGHTSILDIAKAALVVFCEALEQVGDTFAIAGFSGSGRHGVDYYRVKDFQTPLNHSVRSRISALRPQRATRMGAAIRHASGKLLEVSSQVKILLMISDGFPNDIGYKADYAISDTRRAVQEARCRQLHFKAITVQMAGDPRLDELYGSKHHHVIADVTDLPGKLLQLYGRLTKI
ncbi:MAG: hypothetical protein GY874_19485 [Desulfobacteraceae bacterium]|nr:hypothetical protein [Desulfobacteraceae bacterium]